MKLKTTALTLFLALATGPILATTPEQKSESAKKLVNIIASAIQAQQINKKPRKELSSLYGPTLAYFAGLSGFFFREATLQSILTRAGNGFLIGGCFDCLSSKELPIQYYYGLIGSLLGLLAQEYHLYELGIPVGAMVGMIIGKIQEQVSETHARKLSDEELEALIARLELALQNEDAASAA